MKSKKQNEKKDSFSVILLSICFRKPLGKSGLILPRRMRTRMMMMEMRHQLMPNSLQPSQQNPCVSSFRDHPS